MQTVEFYALSRCGFLLVVSSWLALLISFSLDNIPSNREAVERAFDRAREFSLLAFLLDRAASPRGTRRQLTPPFVLGVLCMLAGQIILLELAERFLLGQATALIQAKPFMRTVCYFFRKRPDNMANPQHQQSQWRTGESLHASSWQSINLEKTKADLFLYSLDRIEGSWCLSEVTCMLV